MSSTTGTVSVTEAAQRLGITAEEAYRLVFARKLPTVAGPTGRRLVPVDAIEGFRESVPSTP